MIKAEVYEATASALEVASFSEFKERMLKRDLILSVREGTPCVLDRATDNLYPLIELKLLDELTEFIFDGFDMSKMSAMSADDPPEIDPQVTEGLDLILSEWFSLSSFKHPLPWRATHTSGRFAHA